MIDLLDTTIIIPVKIEHIDRYRNAKTVLGFLNNNLKTNVFIFESSNDGHSKLDFLDDLKNLRIKKWIISSEDEFHRTKYLNIMLDEVETKVVVNYDIDVILHPQNFLECQNSIITGESDVIYPYRKGDGQIQIMPNFDLWSFISSGYDMNHLSPSETCRIALSECGHCIFFNTDIYRKNGAENENFISYGPEDKERMHRFQKLNYKVNWSNNFYVYHFEHYRGSDSSYENPRFYQNWEEFKKIKGMSEDDLREYYSNIHYSVKYNNIKFV